MSTVKNGDDEKLKIIRWAYDEFKEYCQLKVIIEAAYEVGGWDCSTSSPIKSIRNYLSVVKGVKLPFRSGHYRRPEWID